MLAKDGLVQMAAFHSGEIKRGHIDLVLKVWLPTGNTAERVGACYTFPQMSGYFTHECGCDPLHFGGAQGGRPSAWAKENPASGTRVAADPKQRGKYFIHWRGQSSQRVWKECPSAHDLLQAKWKWRSIREPTASDPSSSTQQGQQAGSDKDAPPGSRFHITSFEAKQEGAATVRDARQVQDLG